MASDRTGSLEYIRFTVSKQDTRELRNRCYHAFEEGYLQGSIESQKLEPPQRFMQGTEMEMFVRGYFTAREVYESSKKNLPDEDKISHTQGTGRSLLAELRSILDIETKER